MATEQGIVIRTEGASARVKTLRTEACEGCSARGSCHTLGGGNDMEVEVINAAGARTGDRVVIAFDTAPMLRATFLIYVAPILLMMGGAFAGQAAAGRLGMEPTGLSVLFAFGFLGLGVVLVRIKGNRMARRDCYRPRITRILAASPPEAPPDACGARPPGTDLPPR